MRDGGRWLAATVLTVGLCSVAPLGLWGVMTPVLFYGLLTGGQKILPFQIFMPKTPASEVNGDHYTFLELMHRMVTQKLTVLVAGGLFIEMLAALSPLLTPAFAIAAALGLAVSGAATFAGLHLFCDEKIFPKAAPWVNKAYMWLSLGLVGGLGALSSAMAVSMRSLMLRLAAEVVATKAAVGAVPALLATTVGTSAPGGVVALVALKLTARREEATGGDGKCGSACTCNAGPL